MVAQSRNLSASAVSEKAMPALTKHSDEQGQNRDVSESKAKAKDKDNILGKEEKVLLKDRATMMKGDLADGIDSTIHRYTDNDHNSKQLPTTHHKTDLVSDVRQLVSRHSQFSDEALDCSLVASSPKERLIWHLLKELVRNNSGKNVEDSARNKERQAELQNEHNSDSRKRPGKLPPISS